MPPLEELYRRLLVAYPAGYRQEHEAEMLTTLIDAAAAGRRVPSLPEAADLLVGGLRTRGVIAGRDGWRTLWAEALRGRRRLRWDGCRRLPGACRTRRNPCGVADLPES